ncbi:hypothetical protein [Thermocoleostomius sinensis]|uniref:Uncharacterized protein n=1 Tax=Thermocoleostomius sinensis A174 TaxID=2016057 RepID=A0A9E8ZCP3_9CYAN|nr:hypothetical protein [Thermocoleostomius sinensis]WAL59459.1 hypothetical protein OXH18_20135 [Thermocoleostomius sinensis A174]
MVVPVHPQPIAPLSTPIALVHIVITVGVASPAENRCWDVSGLPIASTTASTDRSVGFSE